MTTTLDALLRFQALRDARAEEAIQLQVAQMQQQIEQLTQQLKEAKGRNEEADIDCKPSL